MGKIYYYCNFETFTKERLGGKRMYDDKKLRVKILNLLKYSNDSELVKTDVSLDKQWEDHLFKHPMANDPLYVMFDYIDTEDKNERETVNELREKLRCIGGEINNLILKYLYIEESVDDNSPDSYNKFINKNFPLNEINDAFIFLIALIEYIIDNEKYFSLINNFHKIKNIYESQIYTVEKLICVYEFYMNKCDEKIKPLTNSLDLIKKKGNIIHKEKIDPEILAKAINSKNLDDECVNDKELITSIVLADAMEKIKKI